MIDSAKKARLRRFQYGTAANLEARIRIHHLFSSTSSSFYSWAGWLMPFDQAMDILEVGCGTGTFWLDNWPRLAKGSTLCLTDVSAAMVDRSRSNFGRKPVPFAVADIEDLPFCDARFDLIMAHHVLYHVSDQKRAFAELLRALRPGGCVSITTNSARHMQIVYDIAREIDSGYPSERHIASFTEEIADRVLPHYFSSIDKHVQNDHLEVTDSQSLLDYVASTLDNGGLKNPDDFYDQYERIVQTEIARRGHFPIYRQSALYLCRP